MRWLALTLLLLSCRERVESRSQTLVEARPLVERGWLPSLLPSSSYDIREVHDVDANITWAAFTFSPSERIPFEAGLMPVGEAAVDGDPGRPWWPAKLRGTLSAGQLKRDGLSLCKAKSEGNGHFAIDWKLGRAYYWSPAR